MSIYKNVLSELEQTIKHQNLVEIAEKINQTDKSYYNLINEIYENIINDFKENSKIKLEI